MPLRSKRYGFLANPKGRQHYVHGPAVWRLSREYDWSRMLISIGHESIKVLAARRGETAHLAIREGRQVLFIDHHASGDAGVISTGQTGKLMPSALHRTRQGAAGRLRRDRVEGSLWHHPAGALHSPNARVATGACEDVRPGPIRRVFDHSAYLEDGRCVARADPRSPQPRDRLGRRFCSRGAIVQHSDAVLARQVREAAEHINALLASDE